jgi:hypothetical protein
MFRTPEYRPRFRMHSPDSFGRSDDLQILGYYAPGKRPTIIDPTSNGSIAEAIMVHEQVHQTLTINTTYGYLTQLLNALARRGHHVDELRLFEAEQWDLHEAAATYSELGLVAGKYPDQFERAIHELPSESVGDPAYRECFDFLNRLLPIDITSPLSLLSAQCDLVVAMAIVALCTDCLKRFSRPELLSPQSVASYLREQSPNYRFLRIAESVVAAPLCQQLLRTRTLEVQQERMAFGWIALEIAKLVPNMEIVTDLHLEIDNFRKTWDPYLSSLDIHHEKVDSADEPLPEIVDDPARFRRIQAGFASKAWSLDALILRAKLLEARNNSFGIMLAFSMKMEQEIFLELLPYPLDKDGHNPAVGLDPVAHFAENRGFLAGILRTDDIIPILQEFPELPTAATFMKSSLRYWVPQTRNRSCLSNSIVACVDTVLSQESLYNALSINDLGTSGRYFIIQVFRNQYAACFANPRNPGYYAIVKITDRSGIALLSALTSRMGVKPFVSSAKEDLGPHTELLKLMALAILQEEEPTA